MYRVNQLAADSRRTCEKSGWLERRHLWLNSDALDLIQGNLIGRAVIKLRRPWALVRGNCLSVLERPAVQQIGRNPRRTERVAIGGGAELRLPHRLLTIRNTSCRPIRALPRPRSLVRLRHSGIPF